MKFPLKERPYDKVHLSPERLAALARETQRVVDANLNDFHAYVHKHQRRMPPAKFKPIKTRDNISVYKELSKQHERIFGPLGTPSSDPDTPFRLNKLVACGTVRGRMGDMLLGTAVRDPASVVVKTSYLHDEIVDCSVLHEFQGASAADPFRFLALKWILHSKPGGLNVVVAPRDMIVMQSSGLVASEGIGYHLLHSVDMDVPECRLLDEQYGFVRCRISTMFIFRQLAPDVIEVYTVNYVEPNGSAPEAVAQATSAKCMAASWKSLAYSDIVKLSWVIKNKAAYMGASSQTPLSTGDTCDMCHKKPTLTGRVEGCRLCDAHICSRCRVTKKLTWANRRLELQVEKHAFCKTCLFRVVHEDAVRIAAEMNAGIPIAPWHKTRGYSTQSRRGTASSSSPSMSRSSESEGDIAHSRCQDRRLSNAASVMSYSAFTDLDVDSYDLTDNNDDVQSVMSPAAQESERKRELYLQYQREVHELDTTATEQFTVYRSQPASTQRCLPPMILPSLARNEPVHVHDHRATTASQEHFYKLYAQMKALQHTAELTSALTRENERKLSLGTSRRWEH